MPLKEAQNLINLMGTYGGKTLVPKRKGKSPLLRPIGNTDILSGPRRVEGYHMLYNVNFLIKRDKNHIMNFYTN